MIKWVILFFLALPRMIYSEIRVIYLYHHKDKYDLQYRYNVARKTLVWINRLLRTKLHINNYEIINTPHDNGRIYIANHNSIFDIMAFAEMSTKPLIFISKKENFKIPFLGAHLKAMEGLAIDRKDLKQSLKICKQAGELANKGYDIVLFPEGTRSKDGNVAPFKAALQSMVFYSKVETIMLCLYNTKKPFAFHFFVYPKIDIYVNVFEPLSYNYFLENRKDFANITRDIIQKQVNAFQESRGK